MSYTSRKIADKALEIRMRDALEGLADFATRFAFTSTPGTLTILSIEAPAAIPAEAPHTAAAARRRAPVIPVGRRRSRDVVSFLLEREARSEQALARRTAVALSA
ncbi:MAG TPA: hypothetical protein ENJ01_09000 [Gammaproteobacteria bacterium]|nr:hypothetical protein [Gammaproteobacteria bacterium]